MMLAPLKTNLMAPLSTCWCGRMKGSMKIKGSWLSVWGHLNTTTKQLPLEDLTFMQQSEGWVKWSFSLSEKEEFSIHCQDFDVFMAVGRIIQILKKHRRKSTVLKTHCMWGPWSVLPSHYFDRVLFWHDVIEPWLDVGKLFQQLVFDAFDHWCFQLDTVRHIFLLIKSETVNRNYFFVYNVLIKKQNKLWPSYDKNLILLSYFNKTCQVYSLIYWRPKYNTNTQYLSHNGAHWSHIVANIGSAQCLVYGLIKLLSTNTHSIKILVTNPNIVLWKKQHVLICIHQKDKCI